MPAVRRGYLHPGAWHRWGRKKPDTGIQSVQFDFGAALSLPPHPAANHNDDIVKETFVILDAYNVIHHVPRLRRALAKSLQDAREALVCMCADWLTQRRDVRQFWVVFDGGKDSSGSHMPTLPGIHALFTRGGESADDRILSMLDMPHGRREMVVVSDDRTVQTGARARGARTLAVSEFLALTQPRSGPKTPGPRETPDEHPLSPSQQAEINQALIREWGLEP